VRTMVHSVEAAIKMLDPHGQSVMIDLIPEGVEACDIDVMKVFPPEPVPNTITFMIEVHVPVGQPCPSCGVVHDQEQTPHDEEQKPPEEEQKQ